MATYTIFAGVNGVIVIFSCVVPVMVLLVVSHPGLVSISLSFASLLKEKEEIHFPSIGASSES